VLSPVLKLIAPEEPDREVPVATITLPLATAIADLIDTSPLLESMVSPLVMLTTLPDWPNPSDRPADKFTSPPFKPFPPERFKAPAVSVGASPVMTNTGADAALLEVPEVTTTLPEVNLSESPDLSTNDPDAVLGPELVMMEISPPTPEVEAPDFKIKSPPLADPEVATLSPPRISTEPPLVFGELLSTT
jgi:hypothetical protein